MSRLFKADYDGFIGREIGSYKTLEGKEGIVLQQINTKVVHVYGKARLTQLEEFNPLDHEQTR